jgi:hypothetical protein
LLADELTHSGIHGGGGIRHAARRERVSFTGSGDGAPKRMEAQVRCSPPSRTRPTA